MVECLLGVFTMRNYVSMFCDEFKYPAEAKECFLDAFDKVSACEETAGEFMGLVEAYDLGDDLLDKLTNLAEKCGVHKFTLHLLYFICLSKRLRELYEENNLPYEIYYDTVSDLKWKLMECHHVEEYGAPSWQIGSGVFTGLTVSLSVAFSSSPAKLILTTKRATRSLKRVTL